MTGQGPTAGIATCEAALPILERGARTIGLTLNDQQKQGFATYCKLLREVGQHTNLTAIRDADSIMSRLFLDSITILLALPPEARNRSLAVADIGAGAGIPGLPLKIACHTWSVMLIESTGKKARFIEQVAETLNLADVTVVAERAEAVAVAQFRDRADLCVSRAVASLPVLIELTAPFARAGGLLVFPKSGDIKAEIESAGPAMRELRVDLRDVVALPAGLGLGQDHVLVVMEKRAPTPPAYPRRVGLARSQPIGTARPRERRVRRG